MVKKNKKKFGLKWPSWKVMDIVNSAVAVYSFSRRHTLSSYERDRKMLLGS